MCPSQFLERTEEKDQHRPKVVSIPAVLVAQASQKRRVNGTQVSSNN